MICECGNRTRFKTYKVVKCKKCHAIVQGFFKRPAKGWRLRIRYDKAKQEIEVIGDQAGLEYLAEACLGIIGHKDPSGHLHLEHIMYNLSRGSTNTLLQFLTKQKDVQYAATGKPHRLGRRK